MASTSPPPSYFEYNSHIIRYGNPKEVDEFQSWMRCYGKAKSQKDKGGRALWYFEDQVRLL